MPKIDPQQLLKTLGVLLGPHGGIKSSDEVVRLAQLMQKFSKKLVSKCIYIRILKATENDLLEKFLSEGGWELLNQWFYDAVNACNWSLGRELIQLFNICPVSASQLKENLDANNAPRLINQLKQETGIDEDIKAMATEVSRKWMRAKWKRPISPAKCSKSVSKEMKDTSDTIHESSPQAYCKRKGTEPDGNTGILVFHRGKNKRRKTITWAPDTSLVSIQYFEMNEDERVNVNKQKFENMRKYEMQMERAAVTSKTSKTEIVIDDQDIENWYKPVPLTFDENSDNKPAFTSFGAESTEKLAQIEREKTVLQALYFNLKSTPSTPQEPDNPSDTISSLPNIIPKIPLEDKDAEAQDYTPVGWPAAKTNKVNNEYAASISSAFHLPPALSNLLASIDPKGLECIIPTPGSHRQEDHPTIVAQTNVSMKSGIIPAVENSSRLPSQTASQSHPIAPGNVNMNHQMSSPEHFKPFRNPVSADPFPDHGRSGGLISRSSAANLIEQTSSGMMIPNSVASKGFDNFNPQQAPFQQSSIRERMPTSHRDTNNYGRVKDCEFRRASNDSDYSGVRTKEQRYADRKDSPFHRNRERGQDQFKAGRRSYDTNNYRKDRSQNVCFAFRDKGRCSKGDNCGYLHQRSK